MKKNLKYNENSHCVTMVSDQERENIVLATKAQSNCQAWLEHRRVRITVSQSKRALIKP